GAKVKPAVGGGSILLQPGKDIDGSAGEEPAQFLGLAEGGDEEGLAARARQRRSDSRHAQPIGVSLDHRGAFRRRAEVAQAPVVGDESVEIDGKERGGLSVIDAAQSRRSGRRSCAARLPNLVNSGVNWSLTVPVGPW